MKGSCTGETVYVSVSGWIYNGAGKGLFSGCGWRKDRRGLKEFLNFTYMSYVRSFTSPHGQNIATMPQTSWYSRGVLVCVRVHVCAYLYVYVCICIYVFICMLFCIYVCILCMCLSVDRSVCQSEEDSLLELVLFLGRVGKLLSALKSKCSRVTDWWLVAFVEWLWGCKRNILFFHHRVK